MKTNQFLSLSAIFKDFFVRTNKKLCSAIPQGKLTEEVTTMKSIIKAAALTAILSTVVIVLGCAIIPRNVSRHIVNGTGATIAQVYIRESGTGGWGVHVNRTIRTKEESYSCQQCTKNGCYNTYCTRTVYVRGSDGDYVYDTNPLSNGSPYDYRFKAPDTAKGESYKSIDIKLVDNSGFAYGRNNINLQSSERIVITQNDMYPVLTMQNNTGFPISIANPISEHLDNYASTRYQMPELKNDRRHSVSYSIGNYMFDKEVILDRHTTLSLTDRPPTVTVKNNTGFPVSINSPFNEYVGNGGSSQKFPKYNRNMNKQIISYHSGLVEFKKEVTIDEEDVVLTLTEKDRAPVVTILNHTGQTVNLIFLRNPGSSWPEQNILSIKLKEDGTLDNTNVGTQAIERKGSFTNKESFRFWVGNLSNIKPDRYDIRIDDVKGDPYVKNNLRITEDTTLTFIPSDKP